MPKITGQLNVVGIPIPKAPTPELDTILNKFFGTPIAVIRGGKNRWTQKPLVCIKKIKG